MPFRFISRMQLREELGKRAMDEHRLLELIEEVPADSIYYHAHSYFLRHAYTQQLYSNDFAAWVLLYAQDRVLGERLGVLDPFAERTRVDGRAGATRQRIHSAPVSYHAASSRVFGAAHLSTAENSEWLTGHDSDFIHRRRT
jgi:hypothetical protein